VEKGPLLSQWLLVWGWGEDRKGIRGGAVSGGRGEESDLPKVSERLHRRTRKENRNVNEGCSELSVPMSEDEKDGGGFIKQLCSPST
jgi:hypothetical protein